MHEIDKLTITMSELKGKRDKLAEECFSNEILNIEEQILIALYTEYQKTSCRKLNILYVMPYDLCIRTDPFMMALSQLDHKGLITGIHVVMGPGNKVSRRMTANAPKVSDSGIEYVETRLNINKSDSPKRKVEAVKAKVAELGYNPLERFAARVLAQMAIQSMGK